MLPPSAATVLWPVTWKVPPTVPVISARFDPLIVLEPATLLEFWSMT